MNTVSSSPTTTRLSEDVVVEQLPKLEEETGGSEPLQPQKLDCLLGGVFAPPSGASTPSRIELLSPSTYDDSRRYSAFSAADSGTVEQSTPPFPLLQQQLNQQLCVCGSSSHMCGIAAGPFGVFGPLPPLFGPPSSTYGQLDSNGLSVKNTFLTARHTPRSRTESCDAVLESNLPLCTPPSSTATAAPGALMLHDGLGGGAAADELCLGDYLSDGLSQQHNNDFVVVECDNYLQDNSSSASLGPGGASATKESSSAVADPFVPPSPADRQSPHVGQSARYDNYDDYMLYEGLRVSDPAEPPTLLEKYSAGGNQHPQADWNQYSLISAPWDQHQSPIREDRINGDPTYADRTYKDRAYFEMWPPTASLQEDPAATAATTLDADSLKQHFGSSSTPPMTAASPAESSIQADLLLQHPVTAAGGAATGASSVYSSSSTALSSPAPPGAVQREASGTKTAAPKNGKKNWQRPAAAAAGTTTISTKGRKPSSNSTPRTFRKWKAVSCCAGSSTLPGVECKEEGSLPDAAPVLSEDLGSRSPTSASAGGGGSSGGMTTIMLRNIPNKYTQKMLLDVIDNKFQGLYDFFYLPIDFRNKCNVGYAFINFLHSNYATQFKKEFDGLKLSAFKSNKVCEVSWGRVQGLAANIEHYRNSAVMSIPIAQFKPLLLKHGLPVSFPTADGPLPTVKLRPQKC